MFRSAHDENAPPRAAATSAPNERAGSDDGWLFVLPWALSHPGGVNQVVENLYDANRRVLGGRSLLLVTSWDDRLRRRETIAGRPTIYWRLRDPWDPGRRAGSLLRYALWLPAVLQQLGRLLTDESVRLINVHYPGLTALTWTLLPAVIAGRVRLALSFHGMDVAAASRSRGLERWLWRRLLGAASAITVCHPQLKATLLRLRADTAAKITVVDNGVDPAIDGKTNAAASLAPAGPYLLSLGTFEIKKGHDVTISAFADAAQRHPALRLIIAGRNPEESTLPALRSLADRLGIGDRVLLLPDVDHVAAMSLLRSAHALVLASRDEPFGIVVLEAGVFRRPVIATSLCGAAQRLPEDALLRIAADDAAALAAAIDRMLADAALAQRLGARLHAAVAERFTWDRVVRSYLAAMQAPVATAPQPQRDGKAA